MKVRLLVRVLCKKASTLTTLGESRQIAVKVLEESRHVAHGGQAGLEPSSPEVFPDTIPSSCQRTPNLDEAY